MTTETTNYTNGFVPVNKETGEHHIDEFVEDEVDLTGLIAGWEWRRAILKVEVTDERI